VLGSSADVQLYDSEFHIYYVFNMKIVRECTSKKKQEKVNKKAELTQV